MGKSRNWVWFDLENTPHVLFLEPLIRRLGALGWDVRISAKPQAQTLELARLRGLDVQPVGNGDFRRALGKITGGVARARTLRHWVLEQGKPRLFVSSSRSGSLAAWLLRVPAIGMLDYEHAEQRTLALGFALWMPDLLQQVELRRSSRSVARFYAGLKENLYLDCWHLDRDHERAELGVSSGDFVVVARPPAVAAHYATRSRNTSHEMWFSALSALAQRPEVKILVISRSAKQRDEIRTRVSGTGRVEFLNAAVSGPGLVSAADLVLGGGGTMNREGAVIGTPVWSTFCGPMPCIDSQLANEGRLRWICSEEDLATVLSQPLPSRMDRRGPFPDGIAAITQAISERLGPPGKAGPLLSAP